MFVFGFNYIYHSEKNNLEISVIWRRLPYLAVLKKCIFICLASVHSVCLFDFWQLALNHPYEREKYRKKIVCLLEIIFFYFMYSINVFWPGTVYFACLRFNIFCFVRVIQFELIYIIIIKGRYTIWINLI